MEEKEGDGTPFEEVPRTHVAGTVAAKGLGVTGVAPRTKIAAYKVFDRVRFPTPDGVQESHGAFDGPVFAAIVDASLRGFEVINRSLGGTLDRSAKDRRGTPGIASPRWPTASASRSWRRAGTSRSTRMATSPASLRICPP
jgi:subtilisin family serine protease